MTRDIPMDEIWEILFKERMIKKRKNSRMLYSPEDFQRKKQIVCSWKDAYFNGVFVLDQLTRDNISYYTYELKCNCVTSHLILDLVFGIYSLNGVAVEDFYNCFSKEKSFSIHRVCRCAHKCPRRLTLQRYSNEYQSNHLYSSFSTPKLIQIMVNVCKISLRHISISIHCEQIWNYMQHSHTFVDKLSQLLVSVNSVEISRLQNPEMAKELLDIIFFKNCCAVTHVTIDDVATPYFCPYASIMERIGPCLTQSVNCKLKQLGVHLDASSEYDEAQMMKIMEQYHQTLEEVNVKFHTQVAGMSILPAAASGMIRYISLIQCMANLLHKPSFRYLTLSLPYHLKANNISPDVLLALLSKFFSSPCPVSLSLQCINCSNFDPLILPSLIISVNQEQQLKSLEIEQCLLSVDLFAFLPTHLVLDKLILNTIDFNTLSLFACMESIMVNTFTLNMTNLVITNGNIADVCKLMSVVTALQEYNLHLCIDIINPTPMSSQHTLALCKFAHRGCIRSLSFCSEISLTILEAMFCYLNSKSSVRLAYFELGISILYLSKDLAKKMYALWKKYGSVKLDKIKLYDYKKKQEGPEKFLTMMAHEVLSEQSSACCKKNPFVGGMWIS